MRPWGAVPNDLLMRRLWVKVQQPSEHTFTYLASLTSSCKLWTLLPLTERSLLLKTNFVVTLSYTKLFTPPSYYDAITQDSKGIDLLVHLYRQSMRHLSMDFCFFCEFSTWQVSWTFVMIPNNSYSLHFLIYYILLFRSIVVWHCMLSMCTSSLWLPYYQLFQQPAALLYY